jgi:hypothetical protein
LRHRLAGGEGDQDRADSGCNRFHGVFPSCGGVLRERGPSRAGCIGVYDADM